MSTATLAGIIIGAIFLLLWIIAAYFFGFVSGLAVHAYLAVVYKRDASDAVNEAASRAYADHLKELRKTAEEKKAFDESPLPTQPDEQQQAFEEGIATLYPGDDKLQEEARAQREFRKRMGR